MSAETRVAMDGYTSNNSVKPKDYDIEMVSGTPNSPKTGQPDKPAVHMVANERRANEKTHNHNGHGTHDGAEPAPSQPLLEPDKEKPKPPLAGPEVDDLDDEPASPTAGAPYPGIDDGLLEGDSKPNENGHNGNDDDHNEHGSDDEHHHILRGGGHETDDGNWWPTGGDVDTTDGVHLGNRFGDDRPISPFPGSIPDVNTYQQKKNLAQGMMDLALLSANANQLRYVLESSSTHPYFYFSLVFISLSIILQVAVGIGLIMNSRYNVKDDKDICKADKINNFTVIGIFMITVVNVFITSFSVASNNPDGVVRSDSG